MAEWNGTHTFTINFTMQHNSRWFLGRPQHSRVSSCREPWRGRIFTKRIQSPCPDSNMALLSLPAIIRGIEISGVPFAISPQLRANGSVSRAHSSPLRSTVGVSFFSLFAKSRTSKRIPTELYIELRVLLASTPREDSRVLCVT